MRIRQLPKDDDINISQLMAGKVFEWNNNIFVRLNDDCLSLKKDPKQDKHLFAFNLTCSVVACFNTDVRVTWHKKATLVLDGSTLEELK